MPSTLKCFESSSLSLAALKSTANQSPWWFWKYSCQLQRLAIKVEFRNECRKIMGNLWFLKLFEIIVVCSLVYSFHPRKSLAGLASYRLTGTPTSKLVSDGIRNYCMWKHMQTICQRDISRVDKPSQQEHVGHGLSMLTSGPLSAELLITFVWPPRQSSHLVQEHTE